MKLAFYNILTLVFPSKLYVLSVILCLKLRGSLKILLDCSTFMFNDVQRHSGHCNTLIL